MNFFFIEVLLSGWDEMLLRFHSDSDENLLRFWWYSVGILQRFVKVLVLQQCFDVIFWSWWHHFTRLLASFVDTFSVWIVWLFLLLNFSIRETICGVKLVPVATFGEPLSARMATLWGGGFRRKPCWYRSGHPLALKTLRGLIFLHF